jgi:hypothetical protein
LWQTLWFRSDDLGQCLAVIDREFLMDAQASQRLETDAGDRVLVVGTALRLHPVVRDNFYRIAREAIRQVTISGIIRYVRSDDSENAVEPEESTC